MKQTDLSRWQQFCRTERVMDYLLYKKSTEPIEEPTCNKPYLP